MSANHFVPSNDSRAQRAALRDRILSSARLLGWPARTTIAFAEQLSHHPWKRCSDGELAVVLAHVQAILGVCPGPGRGPRMHRKAHAERQLDWRDADAECA